MVVWYGSLVRQFGTVILVQRLVRYSVWSELKVRSHGPFGTVKCLVRFGTAVTSLVRFGTA